MKKETETRRKIKGSETRNKLFETAGKLFEKYEFDDVSVDAIVEAAGVSKGTFYVHFESKDALIAAYVSDFVSKVDMNYQGHLNSLPEDMPASEVLLSLIGKITDVLVDDIGYNNMTAVYKVQLTRALDMQAVMGYNRELYKMFLSVLDRGVRRGEFKTGLALDTLTQHFVMAIRGLSYEWCIRYPDFDLKEQALNHYRILLSGIKA